MEPTKCTKADAAALKKSHLVHKKKLPNTEEISEPTINPQMEASLCMDLILLSGTHWEWEIHLFAEVLVISSCLSTVPLAVLPLSLASTKPLPCIFIHCPQADNTMTLLEVWHRWQMRNSRVVWIQEGH